MNRAILSAFALALPALALASLPPPDEAAKAKAAEAAAKSAWAAKVAAYETCEVQDRIAAAYKKSHGTGQAVATTTAAPKPTTTPTTASQGGGTPVADVAPAAPVVIPPCVNPGPFAYTRPEEKPLETSEAHSPAGNATSPPSVRQESAKMVPTKPSTATKK